MLLALLYSFLLSFHSPVTHDFHVSLTEMEYRDQEIQVTMKVFANDLKLALERRGQAIDLTDTKTASEPIEDYLSEHFALYQRSKRLDGHLVGYEQEVEVIYLYYAVEMTSQPDQLTVENRLFFELFEDQSHIVNFKKEEDWVSVFLSVQKPKGDLNL